MDTHNFFMSRKLFSSLIQTILITAFIQKSLSADQQFEACAPRTCGNGTDISYPFWLSHEQEPHCGYPNLEITCNNKEPVLKICDEDYIIRDIFYSRNSVILVNAVVFSDACPIPVHNFSLAGTPFNFSFTHSDLHVFYNCTVIPPELIPYQSSCANTSHESFASFLDERVLNFLRKKLEICQSHVIIPVDVGGDDSVRHIIHRDYREILKNGFLLEWDSSSCSECKGSGGRCGFDNNQPWCFCRDGNHGKTLKCRAD